MLSYNEITTGKVITFNNEPYKVISHKVFRMQKSKPQNVTKLKSLKSGKVIEKSFHQSDKVSEAEIDKKNVEYIYENRDEYMFHNEGDPSKRFPLSSEIIGNATKFLKPKDIYKVLIFNNEIIGIDIPIKMRFKVKDAPPAVKGNTATGATKTVTLETGATINCPLFINEGDIIEINTETGEYSSRIKKA